MQQNGSTFRIYSKKDNTTFITTYFVDKKIVNNFVKNICSMCKRKDYSASISQYAEELIFRVVYASFSDFISKYIGYFKSIFPDSSFRERIITQEEGQIVDVDTIAADLDITIEDVLNEKVYILTTEIEQYDFSVFIGNHYLVVKLNIRGKDVSNHNREILAQMLDTQSIKENIEIIKFYCQLSHTIATSSRDELGTVLDLSIFEGIDADIKNSRYADSYLYNNYDIQLTRELRDIIFEKDKSNGVYANVSCFINAEVKEEYSVKDIEHYIEILQQETTQCFK